MTQHPSTGPPVRPIRNAVIDAGGWSAVLASTDGLLPDDVVATLGSELAEVARLVAERERAAPPAHPQPAVPDGAHALLALIAARAGEIRHRDQLIAVAAAVELAHRATRHHAAVMDRAADDLDGVRRLNQQRVLDGDWSITEAATLTAGVGPGAYRVLVRGYGAAEVASLLSPFRGRAGTPVEAHLGHAAIALGALVAGLPGADRGVAVDGTLQLPLGTLWPGAQGAGLAKTAHLLLVLCGSSADPAGEALVDVTPATAR